MAPSTQTQNPPASSRASSITNGHPGPAYPDDHGDATRSPNTVASKKGKSKKIDPTETSKLVAAKISQLELDAAGEKDQEAEIEREVKKANRDLNNLLGTMEPLSRLDVVQKKYTDLLSEMKRLSREHAKDKKRADQLQKEKDQGRSELSKTITMKDRLEKLCRELTKDNKQIKEEKQRLEQAERKSRELLNEKFDSMLWDAQDLMNQKESKQNQKQTMELDELFRQKFRSFIEQSELRELHFQSLMRSKEYEVQYHLAKYEQQRKAAEAEAAKARTLNAQVATFSTTESELRSQLNIYVEKFKQVEDTLNNSNDLFLTFRKEMEEMSKKTKRLEKENLQLTRKHDLTNRNILEMAEERTRINKEMEIIKKKNENLESLCRRMQDQGRGIVEDDEATDSEYDYEDGEGSEEEEYDEETEEDEQQQQQQQQPQQLSQPQQQQNNVQKPPFIGPEPPPLPSSQALSSRVAGSLVNGVKH